MRKGQERGRRRTLKKRADSNKNDTAVLLGVGDIGPIREDAERLFDLNQAVLNQADIVFGQLERVLSARESLQISAGGRALHPRYAKIFRDAGFDVLSCAGNKALDCGPEGVLDTVEILERNGIRAIGIGRNLDDATRPLLLESNGTRIAFVPACSVAPKGHEAGPDRPGVAPLRVTTRYEPLEFQPGTPCRIVTTPDRRDLSALKTNIRRAKEQADIVVVSLHWGLHLVPKAIAMYQPVVAHAAIDAGADLILGHHTHILKGIEVYKGKVVFYSLGNFAMEKLVKWWAGTPMGKIYNVQIDPDSHRYAFPEESRNTLIAKAVIKDRRIERVSFLPAYINREAQAEVLRPVDWRFRQVADYVRDISEEFSPGFEMAGDEVVIRT
ncbi:MAG: CapA family protein [Chloroflexi bacterium]|nr:CapA family protein [Chloroflexota bacterium]